eukprot:TRINITY_DN1296_c0_g1_i1.p1 TRINITY_DN1296_c0_g1~~TRINITY_DN1296_c0_g1_i1.p1  ORF type:complete len:388 (-),score=121.73 TRINITY_DN1296_c0_g1_i1:99-1262(-)
MTAIPKELSTSSSKSDATVSKPASKELSKTIKLCICVAGIYISFITWAIFQEKVSTTEYQPREGIAGLSKSKFGYVKFLNLVQCLAAALAGLAFLVVTGHRASLQPLDQYLKIAFTNTVGSPFSYVALRFISYPMVTLVKSCKLVPVMIMGTVVGKKSYSVTEYLCCVLISLGVVMFTCMKPGLSSSADSLYDVVIGISLVLINLAFDGCTNALQDRMYEKHHMSPAQMMFSMNLVGAVFLLGALLSPFDFDQLPIFTGKYDEFQLSAIFVGFGNFEIFDAIQFVLSYRDVLTDVMLFSICGATGQLFIFFCISEFGSVVNTIVTITRKFFTIFFSLLWFMHPFSMYQVIGVVMVFGGLGLNVAIQYQKPPKKKKVEGGAAETKKDK